MSATGGGRDLAVIGAREGAWTMTELAAGG